jgi:hypothetical protein
MNKNKKIPKRILAIPAATPATPVNPNRPAMIEIIKKITAHFNISNSSPEIPTLTFMRCNFNSKISLKFQVGDGLVLLLVPEGGGSFCFESLSLKNLKLCGDSGDLSVGISSVSNCSSSSPSPSPHPTGNLSLS